MAFFLISIRLANHGVNRVSGDRSGQTETALLILRLERCVWGGGGVGSKAI